MSRKEKLTNPYTAHAAGTRAKQKGWSRDLPPYDDRAGVFYFLAGYDGISLDAIARATHTLRGVADADPIFRLRAVPAVISITGWNADGQAFIR